MVNVLEEYMLQKDKYMEEIKTKFWFNTPFIRADKVLHIT